MSDLKNYATILYHLQPKVARSGTPGPVFVELPVDTLYPASTVEKEISNTGGKQSKKKTSLLQKATQIYLKR